MDRERGPRARRRRRDRRLGPVGQALAALLGRAGHRVVVFERFNEIYRLPRAVHLDHETMRLLQSLGLAEALAQEMVPVHDYQWFGADGELLFASMCKAQRYRGGSRITCSSSPSSRLCSTGVGCAQPGGRHAGMDCRGADGPRWRCGAERAPGYGARSGQARSHRRYADRAREVGRRRRRCKLVRARGKRHLPPRSRLSGALVGRRR